MQESSTDDRKSSVKVLLTAAVIYLFAEKMEASCLSICNVIGQIACYYFRLMTYSIGKNHMSRGMGFPTMWYVRPAKPQTSLHIRAV